MSNPLGLLAGEWCAADAWRRAQHLAAADPDPLLHGWQQVGALVVADMIRRWGGAILADDVGLGKTHSAMAVARYLDARAALVAPAAILPQWRALLDARGIHWPMFSTTRLSRGMHPVGPDIEACDLIIVDEGHHFRNPGTQRYATLAHLAISRRLLFLSATPIQNSANDLLALFRLFLPDTVIESLQAPHSVHCGQNAGPDLAALSGLIGSMVVRRTREELDRRPAVTDFSSRRRISYVADDPDPDVLAALTRAPSAAMGLQGDPEALYRMVLLKRFASSPRAAVATLKRGRNYLLRLQEAVAAGRTLSRSEFRRAFGGDVVDQMRQSVLPFWYADSSSNVDAGDIGARVELLDDVIARVASLGHAHGGIARLVSDEVREHSPAILFTAYTETARALFELLRQDANCVLWTGSEVRVSRWTRVELDEALDIFRWGHPLLPALPRVLISTAVASEGLNLVEAKTVIHADLCWNPARLDQRTGRADRTRTRRRATRGHVRARPFGRTRARAGPSDRAKTGPGTTAALVKGKLGELGAHDSAERAGGCAPCVGGLVAAYTRATEGGCREPSDLGSGPRNTGADRPASAPPRAARCRQACGLGERRPRAGGAASTSLAGSANREPTIGLRPGGRASRGASSRAAVGRGRDARERSAIADRYRTADHRSPSVGGGAGTATTPPRIG